MTNSMKKFLLLCLFCSTFLACSEGTTDKSVAADESGGKDGLSAHSDSSIIAVNATLPFGCASLTTLKLPKHWEADPTHYGQLKQPGSQDWDDILQCFAALHSAKTITPPTVNSLEVLSIGDNFNGAFNLDTLLQRSIDSCRYRLPDIGRYECYYAFNRYGNLLLLDPETKAGKVLHIYADDMGGDSHTVLRYFYIDSNVIAIYEGACYDDGCSLNEAYKIRVNPDGEIVLSRL